MRDRKVNLMLDSGAYTAFRRGKALELAPYIKYCQDNAHLIERPVNLDVIPGKPGQRRTSSMVEESAKASWKNALAMRRAGVECIPVFHRGERTYWLDKMIGEGFDWIGIASFNDSTDGRREWLDMVWSHLCARGGFPGVRIHGFAETQLSIMLHYPWYSVDSSSWCRGGAYFQILVPRGINRLTFIFLGTSEVRMTKRHRMAYAALAPKDRDEVDRFIADHGFAVSEFTDVGQLARQNRSAYNACIYQWLIANHKPKRLRVDQDLFSELSPHGNAAYKWPKMRMFFSTDLQRMNGNALNRANATDRLLSFDHFKGGRSSVNLATYVRTGLPHKTRARL